MMINSQETVAFVCPDCRNPLAEWYCRTCGVRFVVSNGIPRLLSADKRFAPISDFGVAYDDIYLRRTAVWEDQGRTPEFSRYFADLAASLSTGSLLEIGCGEGFLLRDLRAADKTAIDISEAALRVAASRVAATFCVAAAERLPFPNESFDIVVSVGVMEHFLDDEEATREVRRVLRPGGRCLALIHTGLTIGQCAIQKIREYVYPRPRPIAFARWLGRKAYRPVYQPIQRKYTSTTAQARLERSGLSVERVLSLATDPGVPLIGPHVVIYVGRK